METTLAHQLRAAVEAFERAADGDSADAEHDEALALAETASAVADRLRADEDRPERFAIVATKDVDAVRAYLPRNYNVVGATREGARAAMETTWHVLIRGRDSAGWTLDDYVIPRLASGLYFAEEVAPLED